MGTEKHKIYWLDSLKLLAALLVFSTHFLAEYAPKFLVYWEEGHIFYGISGKLAVSFFFLMSGYFAMKTKRENTWQYIVKRYLRLAVPVLVVEAAMLFLMLCYKQLAADVRLPAEMAGHLLKLEEMNRQVFLSDIFFLGGKVVVTYWGNFMLFAGPVIVVILHGVCNDRDEHARTLFAAAGIIFFLAGYPWYSVCMLGALLYLLISKERQFEAVYQWIIKIVLLIILVFCVRTPETNAGYIWKGLASFCLVFFVFYDKTMQVVLENKVCKLLSKYSFEIYLVHTPVNIMVMPFVFAFLEVLGMNHRLILMCAYLIALFLTLLCSKGLYVVVERTMKVLFDRIK